MLQKRSERRRLLRLSRKKTCVTNAKQLTPGVINAVIFVMIAATEDRAAEGKIRTGQVSKQMRVQIGIGGQRNPYSPGCTGASLGR